MKLKTIKTTKKLAALFAGAIINVASAQPAMKETQCGNVKILVEPSQYVLCEEKASGQFEARVITPSANAKAGTALKTFIASAALKRPISAEDLNAPDVKNLFSGKRVIAHDGVKVKLEGFKE